MGTYDKDIQKAYVAFFNRPADVGGLNYWNDQATKAGGIAPVLAAFGASAEYKALYANKTNYQIVETIFQNLFNRSAEPTALSYWGDRLSNGTFNLGNFAYSIFVGAQNADKTAVDNKVTAAGSFTTALDTNAKILAYETVTSTGSDAVKAWLKAVTDVATTIPTADSINSLLSTVATNSTGSATAGSSFALTAAASVVNGTDGNDLFVTSGTNLQGSVIDGKGGTDTLNVTAVAAVVNPGQIKSVEKIFSMQTATGGGETLNLVNATGVTEVWSDRSTANASITNIQSNVKVGLVGTDKTLTTSFATAVTAGAADTLNVVVDTVTANSALTTGGGFETISITSQGAANTMADLADSSAKTLKVLGDKALTLTTSSLNAALTVDASGMTAGGLNITVGTTGGDVKFTGSSADDRIAFAANDITATDTVNGGAGVNTLALGAVANLSVVKAANVSNIQTIELTGNETAVDWANVLITGVNKMVFSNTANAQAIAISGHKSAYTYDLTGGAATDETSFTVTTLGETDSLSNTLNIRLINSDVGSIVGNTGGNTIETMNITSSKAADGITLEGSANTLGTVTVNAGGTINLTGNAATTLVLGAAATLDASSSAFTGTIKAAGSASTDVIKGTAGADVILGLAGADTLTGGLGADKFVFGAKAGITSNTGANVDKITDFVAGTDKIAFDVAGALLVSAGGGSTALTGAGDILTGITFAAGTAAVATVKGVISDTTTVVNSIGDVYTQLATSLNNAAGFEFAASAADGTATVARVVEFTQGTAAGKYLVVNDQTAAFQAANDLVINITGVTGTISASDFVFA